MQPSCSYRQTDRQTDTHTYYPDPPHTGWVPVQPSCSYRQTDTHILTWSTTHWMSSCAAVMQLQTDKNTNLIHPTLYEFLCSRHAVTDRQTDRHTHQWRIQDFPEEGAPTLTDRQTHTHTHILPWSTPHYMSSSAAVMQLQTHTHTH